MPSKEDDRTITMKLDSKETRLVLFALVVLGVMFLPMLYKNWRGTDSQEAENMDTLQFDAVPVGETASLELEL